jgi:hypothetical protein
MGFKRLEPTHKVAMQMRLSNPLLLASLGVLVAAASCTLITDVDRSKIPDGTAGVAAGGDGTTHPQAGDTSNPTGGTTSETTAGTGGTAAAQAGAGAAPAGETGGMSAGGVDTGTAGMPDAAGTAGIGGTP